MKIKIDNKEIFELEKDGEVLSVEVELTQKARAKWEELLKEFKAETIDEEKFYKEVLALAKVIFGKEFKQVKDFIADSNGDLVYSILVNVLIAVIQQFEKKDQEMLLKDFVDFKQVN